MEKKMATYNFTVRAEDDRGAFSIEHSYPSAKQLGRSNANY